MKNTREEDFITEFEYEETQEYEPALDDTYNFEPNEIYFKRTTENWGEFQG